MERKQKSLKGVVLEYPITLIDTSALFSPMNGRPAKGDESYEAQVLRSQMIFDSTIFYREFLESGIKWYFDNTEYSFLEVEIPTDKDALLSLARHYNFKEVGMENDLKILRLDK